MRNILFVFLSLVVLITSCTKKEIEDLCVDPEAEKDYKMSLPSEDGPTEFVGAYTYYSPVCGCNNESYSIDHFAKLEGVTSFTMGDCEN